MKLLHFLSIPALLAAATGVASASTITLSSYGQSTSASNSTYSPPAGVGNSALTIAGGTTYDIGTGGGTWAGPVAGSTWVSNDPGNYPGGANVEPSGTYTYTSTFSDANPGNSTGTISVYADDTTSIFLNGTQITAAAGPGTTGKCTTAQPNCTAVATYTFVPGDFVLGLNTLTFGVQQMYGSAEGVDFAGSVTVTPEPNSLLLLGTGLLAMGGFVYYRRLEA